MESKAEKSSVCTIMKDNFCHLSKMICFFNPTNDTFMMFLWNLKSLFLREYICNYFHQEGIYLGPQTNVLNIISDRTILSEECIVQ